MKKKRRVYEIQDKGKVYFMDFWQYKKSFSAQEVGRKMIFPQYIRNLHSLRNEEEDASARHKNQKNDEVIFSLAWNMMFTDN